jgi:tetratricopeptide (TPR) repeat protein
MFSVTVFAGSSLDSLLADLDNTIEKRDEYLRKKQEGIVIIKKRLAEGDEKSALMLRYTVLDQLFEEYKSFIYDSAFSYARALLRTAYQLKDDSKINEAKVKLSFTLLSAGMFKEALDTLNSVEVNSLSTDSKIDYYYSMARTYYDLTDYSNDQYFSQLYDKRGNQYLAKAIENCTPGSIRYLLMKGLEYMRVRDISNAIVTFESVLKEPELTKHDNAIASSSLGFMYRLANNNEKAKEYLAKAAIADIISSVRETVAIRDLAEVLYNEGNIERAYKYVKIALEDAYFYGAKHRKIQIANVLPIIEGTQLEIVEGQRKNLFYYSIIATVLSLFIVLFAVIIYWQYRKLDKIRLELTRSHQDLEKTNAQLEETNLKLAEANNRLEDANKIKEEYIGSFFKIISEYIEKIEKFRNTIDRKISQKKFEDIRDLVNSMNLKPEREEFFLTFDKTFLKIFPGFVEQFNTMFNPEDRFVIDEEKEGLPTELRIFALIRLGITDNEKIARILDYSVNTIYTYKTRIKNKSLVENEKFEEELMRIRAI